MHIFCLDYTVSVSKSYPLRVQNKLTTSTIKSNPSVSYADSSPIRGALTPPLIGEVPQSGEGVALYRAMRQ